MMPNAAWVWLVVSFAFIAICAMAPFLVWAFRSGQFRDSHYVRSLALTCTARQRPEEEEEEDDTDV